jgi:putative transposase
MLARICRSAGYVKAFRVDNSSEFVIRVLSIWPTREMSRSTYPGMANRLRAERLNTHSFMSLNEAHVKMEEWVKTIMTSDHTVRSATSHRSCP